MQPGARRFLQSMVQKSASFMAQTSRQPGRWAAAVGLSPLCLALHVLKLSSSLSWHLQVHMLSDCSGKLLYAWRDSLAFCPGLPGQTSVIQLLLLLCGGHTKALFFSERHLLLRVEVFLDQACDTADCSCCSYELRKVFLPLLPCLLTDAARSCVRQKCVVQALL